MNTNVPDTYAKEGSLAYSAFMEGSTMFEDLKLALFNLFFYGGQSDSVGFAFGYMKDLALDTLKQCERTNLKVYSEFLISQNNQLQS